MSVHVCNLLVYEPNRQRSRPGTAAVEVVVAMIDNARERQLRRRSSLCAQRSGSVCRLPTWRQAASRPTRCQYSTIKHTQTWADGMPTAQQLVSKFMQRSLQSYPCRAGQPRTASEIGSCNVS